MRAKLIQADRREFGYIEVPSEVSAVPDAIVFNRTVYTLTSETDGYDRAYRAVLSWWPNLHAQYGGGDR